MILTPRCGAMVFLGGGMSYGCSMSYANMSCGCELCPQIQSAVSGKVALKAPSLQEQPAWTAASMLLVDYGLLGCGVSCAMQLYLGSPPGLRSTSNLELESTGINASLKTYLKLVLFLCSRAGRRAVVLLEAYITAVPLCQFCVAALLLVLV